MAAAVVNSDQSLSKLLGDIRAGYSEHRYLRVTVKTGKDRSLDQSAISHVWYTQIANELREADALGVKCECKLNYGVPILRAEDAEFLAFYDLAIKPHLSYEQKVDAMKYLPVTSLMTVPQLSAYLVAMQKAYEKRGVILVFPESPK